MSEELNRISEYDLQAYADDLLDRDPRRKAAVESYLRARPAEADRIADYMEQNRAIRERFEAVLTAPIPPRLETALDGREPPGRSPMLRAASVAVMVLGAGVTGWWIGQASQPELWPVQAFVEFAMGPTAAPAAAVNTETADLSDGTTPLDWLAKDVSSDLQAPDLSSLGFTLIDKRRVLANGQSAVQFAYADSDGRRLSLFLRARWPENPPEFNFAEKDGITMTYWHDGPLGYGLAGDLGRDELLSLANAVRRSISTEPPATSAASASVRLPKRVPANDQPPIMTLPERTAPVATPQPASASAGKM